MHFESPFEWNLYGSEGRTALGGNFRQLFRREDGAKLIAGEMFISASWIDRTADRISFTELHKEFSVAFHQLILHVDVVSDLVKRLGAWLESRTAFSMEICQNQDQAMTFYLGPPRGAKRLASTIFEIDYSGIDFGQGKWTFAVDQSCIRIFLDELQTSVTRLADQFDI